MNELILNSKSVFELNKDQLDCLVNDLLKSTDKSPLDLLADINKFKYIIETMDKILRDDAKANFIQNFGGSKTEEYLGFKMQLRETTEWKFTDKIDKINNQIKVLQVKLKAEKEKEKLNGEATKTSEGLTLALTLK